MKKLISTILLFSLSAFVFGQSISITPIGDEVLVTKYGNTSTVQPNMLGRTAGGTNAAPTATPSGVGLLTLAGRGYVTAFNTSNNVAINFVANQLFTNTAKGTYINFQTTADNTISLVERMRINHIGNVGIGTSNPLSLLHITKGISGVTPSSASNVFIDDNANNYLGLASTDATETGILFGKPTLGASSGGIIYDNSNNMLLRTGGNNTRVSITSTGLVGIGNASPTGKLHITHSGSDSEPHLNIQATTGALGRIRWTTATNANSWIAQTSLESPTASSNYWRLEYNSGSRLFINGDGRLGIGSDAPTAKLHVEGDLALSKITTTAVNGGYNDYDRQGSSILRFTNGGIINGVAGGADGMILYIFNTGSSALSINNQNTGSAAANRIITHTGSGVNLGTIGGVTMIYDGSSSRWRIVSIAQ